MEDYTKNVVEDKDVQAQSESFRKEVSSYVSYLNDVDKKNYATRDLEILDNTRKVLDFVEVLVKLDPYVSCYSQIKRLRTLLRMSCDFIYRDQENDQTSSHVSTYDAERLLTNALMALDDLFVYYDKDSFVKKALWKKSLSKAFSWLSMPIRLLGHNDKKQITQKS